TPRRRNEQRGAPAHIERIAVRNDGAEGVVAAAKVQDHEIAAARALRPSDVREKRGRRKTERKGADAASHEVSSGHFHTNWYHADAASKCMVPAVRFSNCASDPVHVPPARM